MLRCEDFACCALKELETRFNLSNVFKRKTDASPLKIALKLLNCIVVFEINFYDLGLVLVSVHSGLGQVLDSGNVVLSTTLLNEDWPYHLLVISQNHKKKLPILVKKKTPAHLTTITLIGNN